MINTSTWSFPSEGSALQADANQITVRSVRHGRSVAVWETSLDDCSAQKFAANESFWKRVAHHLRDDRLQVILEAGVRR